jgi:phosphate transport system substrate-binding protein
MRNRTSFLQLFVVVAAGGATPLSAMIQPAAAEAPVRLCGSTTVIANVFERSQAEIARLAGTQIAIVGNGSRQGLTDLANGRCDIAMTSAPVGEVLGLLPPTERAALPLGALTVSSLGDAKLLFIVHASNPVKRLTIAQLSDLFVGAATNWKQVGGPDLGVDIVSNQFSSGQRAVVQDKVTMGKPILSGAKVVVNDSLIPGVVRQLKGSLGHAAAYTDLAGTHVVAVVPPITLPMALVTLGTPQGRLGNVVAAAQTVAHGR